MKPRFEIHPQSFDEVHALPEAWNLSDYREILAALDFDDASRIDESEAQDLCLMAVTDLEPEEAAKVVLHQRLGDRLRRGQIDDIAHDMVDEPLWEDYSDMSVHEELYNVNQLLYDAFHGRFPRPRAVRVAIRVKALGAEAATMLAHPTEDFVVRLLAGGLDEDSLLHRLFEDQLAGAPFPEAASILWRCEPRATGAGEAEIIVTGSAYWLHQLEEVGVYEATAFGDAFEKSSSATRPGQESRFKR